jgi:hypothetical protein
MDRKNPGHALLFWLALCAVPIAALGQETKPAGKESSTTTKVLETGADMLQNDEPIDQLSIYLVGFHPMKHDPAHQMIAHHYCHQANEDFAQCVLFDGNSETANMNGIEYIISEKLFETLPLEEKKYWHPHNYEILSGQLVAPGIPDAVEHKVMDGKMNSYGKTWHVWMTGMFQQQGDKLPFGEPHLAWSFNRDGEDKPGIVAARDKALDVNTTQKKRNRADLVAKAKPQCGVDAIKASFIGSKDLQGVTARVENCPNDGGHKQP